MSKIVGVEQAIRAQAVINTLTTIDADGNRVPREIPISADNLPDWVQEAIGEGTIFMTPNDGFRHVWVETPYMVNPHTGIYVVAGPQCIMLDKGEGQVSILAEPNWEVFFAS